MERTRKPLKIPVAILTSDWHLREDQPICRIDDFWKEQWQKVDCIRQLQQKYHCYVIHAGDLFHHWKPSPFLLSQTIEYLPEQFYTIYGQHDLPQHNFELRYKSGIHTLIKAEKVYLLGNNLTNISYESTIQGVHWEMLPMKIDADRNKILVWHKMNYQGKPPWPDCPDPMAATLLRKYPEYDLIVTGDNHKPFIEEYQGRLLVNPGSLTRQEADQVDHQPRVYLYYEDNSVKPVFLPINKDVISREHIEVREQRDRRIEAFVEQLNTEYDATMSFEDNLEVFKKTNNVREKVMEIIYKAIE